MEPVTSVTPDDIQAVSGSAVTAVQAQPNQPGLRMAYCYKKSEVESVFLHGLPFGTSLGAQELIGLCTPLKSTLHHGSLAYYDQIASDEITRDNLRALSARKAFGNDLTDCVLIISFPDNPKRYEEIKHIQNDPGHSDTYSKSDIYVVLTLQWINYFLDFDEQGDQIIPRNFIAGYIDLENITFRPNPYFGMPFVQSDQAKQKLPVNWR